MQYIYSFDAEGQSTPTWHGFEPRPGETQRCDPLDREKKRKTWPKGRNNEKYILKKIRQEKNRKKNEEEKRDKGR